MSEISKEKADIKPQRLNGVQSAQQSRVLDSTGIEAENQTQALVEPKPFVYWEKRAFYIPVKIKFLISTSAAILWFLASLYLAQPWLGDLSDVVGKIPALLIILFIALIPGFLNAHVLVSVLLDSPPPFRTDISYPPVSLLIAAYNEAANLPETFRGIKGRTTLENWKSSSSMTAPPTTPLRFSHPSTFLT